MGCDRAGWYSWDRLDNGGVPSPEGIHPAWQRLSVGDRLASTPGGATWFEVAALWGFLLKELSGGRTRLVVSGYAAARPSGMQAVADFLFWEPAHWIMQRRQFSNLKRRAEGRSAEIAPGPEERVTP